MLELGAAAVQGRTALGERAGALDARVARGTRREPFVKGPLCADVDGFSPGHRCARWVNRGQERPELRAPRALRVRLDGVPHTAGRWSGGFPASGTLLHLLHPCSWLPRSDFLV